MSSLFCLYFVAQEAFFVRQGEKTLFQGRAYSGGARTTAGNRSGANAPHKLGVAYSPGHHDDRSLFSFDPTRVTLDPHKPSQGLSSRAGGPIPPGCWRITSYEPKRMGKGALMLTPDPAVRAAYPTRSFDALPFLIHATGRMGSWGCITLPTDDLKRVFKALGCGDGKERRLDLPLTVRFSRQSDTFSEFFDELQVLQRTA